MINIVVSAYCFYAGAKLGWQKGLKFGRNLRRRLARSRADR